MGARVPLERGLAASAGHGRPISAKFEMEQGKLQLSVYTIKDGAGNAQEGTGEHGERYAPRQSPPSHRTG